MGNDRVLKNCMEQMVCEHVTRIIKGGELPFPGICTCPSCVLDIEMEALNRLPSFYVACSAEDARQNPCERGEQYREDIATAVKRAMQIVAKRGHIAPIMPVLG